MEKNILKVQDSVISVLGNGVREMKRFSILRMTAVMVLFLFCMAGSAFARDTNSRITSVRIKLEDNLRNLERADDLPELDIGDFTVPDNGMYHVEDVNWYDYGATAAVGTTPKIEVILGADSKTKSNGDEVWYYFSGSYSSSSVTISGGTFVSANREGSDYLRVVLALKGIRGQYEVPVNAVWSESVKGLATWEAPYEGSGYYNVTLYRDNRKVMSVKTNALSLNLFPWMEREGEYYFIVQTVPYTTEQSHYGEKSEECLSDNLILSQDEVSDGSGKYDTSKLVKIDSGVLSGSNTSTGTSYGNGVNAGWYQQGGRWYFRYPNGQNITNSWFRWNGTWYHFDSSGMMQTGWYKNEHGRYFYLREDGHMKTGWLYLDGYWYFLNTAEGDQEGMMFQNVLANIGDRTYYFDESGHMKSGWMGFPDQYGVTQYYYFYPQQNGSNDYGYMAKNTTIGGFVIDETGKWVH